MKFKRLLFVMFFLTLPILVRTLWFYRGFHFKNTEIQEPAFERASLVQPTLSTPAAIRMASTEKNVVFDQAHRNKYTFTEIEFLRTNLILSGADVLSLKTKGDISKLLTKADAFVIIAPTELYTEEDLESIEEFVHRGGRLLVIADPTRSFAEYDKERAESVMIANEIIEPFKLAFRNDYIYNLTENEGNFRNVFVYPSAQTSITKDISKLVFYASHSLNLGGQTLIAGDGNTLSSLDDLGQNLPVTVLDDSGNVLVIGDMTFLTTPYYQVADNSQLVINIIDFLLSGSRKVTFDDFPNLFQSNIGIQFFDPIILDQDLITAISEIKKNYAMDDIDVSIFDNMQNELDMIVMGIYPPNEDLKKITEPFGIQFDIEEGRELTTNALKPTTATTKQSTGKEISGTPQPTEGLLNDLQTNGTFFQVPGFGKVPSKGFGFLLMDQRDGHTMLVILADSPENTRKLLSLLSVGTLKGCLVEANIAVCKQDSLVYLNTPTLTTSPNAETTIIPELTETPSLETTETPIPSITPTPM